MERGWDIPGFHPPRQERSRATLARLTEAVGDLLVHTEPVELSVRQLLDRADASAGAFYARFDGRDAAFSYTSHAFWAESRGAWAAYLSPERWDGVSAARIVVTVIRTMTRTLLGDAERLRAFLRLSLSLPDRGVLDRIEEHDRFIASGFGALLAEREREIRHDEPRWAAEAGFRHVISAVRDYVVYRAERAREPREEARLILSLCQMYGRYLDVHPVPKDYGEVLALAGREGIAEGDYRGRAVEGDGRRRRK